MGAIFTREFWRAYVLDARRFRRDRHARKRFIFHNLVLLYITGYIGYCAGMFFSVRDPTLEITLGAILALIFAVFGAVRWSQQQESRRQLLADIASAPPGVAERLQRMAHSLTAANERALSEAWLANHVLPDGFVATTRRLKIDVLKERGAWDELPVEVRDWMMRPDGDWPAEKAAGVLLSAETLHTLLWAIDLLPRLRRLDRMVEPLPFNKLAKALQRPAKGVRPTWDLRLERNLAQKYFTRCYAEKIHRGDRDVESEEQKHAVAKWLADIAESDATDQLAGVKTISEIDSKTLHYVTRAAACRVTALSLVMNLLDGRDAWTELSAVAYAPFT